MLMIFVTLLCFYMHGLRIGSFGPMSKPRYHALPSNFSINRHFTLRAIYQKYISWRSFGLILDEVNQTPEANQNDLCLSIKENLLRTIFVCQRINLKGNWATRILSLYLSIIFKFDDVPIHWSWKLLWSAVVIITKHWCTSLFSD